MSYNPAFPFEPDPIRSQTSIAIEEGRLPYISDLDGDLDTVVIHYCWLRFDKVLFHCRFVHEEGNYRVEVLSRRGPSNRLIEESLIKPAVIDDYHENCLTALPTEYGGINRLKKWLSDDRPLSWEIYVAPGRH